MQLTFGKHVSPDSFLPSKPLSRPSLSLSPLADRLEDHPVGALAQALLDVVLVGDGGVHPCLLLSFYRGFGL